MDCQRVHRLAAHQRWLAIRKTTTFHAIEAIETIPARVRHRVSHPLKHTRNKRPREAAQSKESTIVLARGSKRTDSWRGSGQKETRAVGELLTSTARVTSRSGRGDLGHLLGRIARCWANGFCLGPATGRDDCLGQAPGITETTRPVDDLGWPLAIDQRFRHDKTRPKRANLWFGRDSHANPIPFMRSARNQTHRQPNDAFRGSISLPIPSCRGELP